MAKRYTVRNQRGGQFAVLDTKRVVYVRMGLTRGQAEKACLELNAA